MPVIAVTIFTGAFLLFQVQPLIAKYILPWFGGSPAVWTTALLFFQMLLLCGYAYAHLSIRHLGPRAQVVLHVGVLLAALALLPITPAEHWKPQTATPPAWQILALLTATIGLPYFALASTSPLMQAWFSRLRPGVSPYRLYALSNVGSLLALASYPFLVEPVFARTTQGLIWSWGFGIFALSSGVCAVWLWRHPGGAASAEQEADDDGASPVGFGARALWVALPAAASVLLLAVSNQLSQDVAAIPFLWVLPLSLYLLSFIIAFNHQKWYNRPLFAGALVPALTAVIWVMFLAGDASLLLQLGAYSFALFICCMVCHGELARLKPHPRHLTTFYLLIAVGGALGGIFVGLIAPAVFKIFLELHLGLLLCCGLLLIALVIDRRSPLYHGRPWWAWVVLCVAFAGLAVVLDIQATQSYDSAIAKSRNFYGVLTVLRDHEGTPSEQLLLRNGVIDHGVQFLAPGKRHWPTTYYAPLSGAGIAFRHYPRQQGFRIGLIGLGAGTLAAYGREGDYFRFYEINPQVLQMAKTYFTYLADSKAQVEVVLGDARLSLEREAPQGFDILLLDAFSGDAIPVHLLTKEAFDIYMRHLRPDGVIAVHISNRHFNLQPVIRALAKRLELEAVLIVNPSGARKMWQSDWMLLTRNQAFLSEEVIQRARRILGTHRRIGMWTDDYTNLFQLLELY